MTRFVTVNRDTAYLLPPSVEDWLPKDHLARFVVDIVDQLDLSLLPVLDPLHRPAEAHGGEQHQHVLGVELAADAEAAAGVALEQVNRVRAAFEHLQVYSRVD